MLKFAAGEDTDSDDESFDFGYETDLTVLSPQNSPVDDPCVNDSTKCKSAPSNACLSNGEVTVLSDLQTAVINGSLTDVENILSNTPDMCNKLLGSGWTTLMYASNFGKLSIVERLLELGADANVCGPSGCNALMSACKSLCPSEVTHSIIKLLLNAGADITKTDCTGKTALMYAARRGKCETVRWLQDCDPLSKNAKDKQGWTALDWAISRSNVDIVRYLIADESAILAISEDHETISNDVMLVLEQANISVKKKPTKEIPGSLIEESKSLEIKACKSTDDILNKAFGCVTLENKEAEKQMYDRYGQLELLLCGLDLSHLVPVFHEHDIRFSQLLDFTMEDLNIIGIKQHGAKLRILKAVHDWHGEEWNEDSLPNLTRSSISFSKVQGILKSSKEHVHYIGRTLRFVQKQLHTSPQILVPPANVCHEVEPHSHVLKQVEDILLSTHDLCLSLKHLHLQAKKTSKVATERGLQIAQVDCISDEAPRQIQPFILAFAAVLLFGLLKKLG